MTRSAKSALLHSIASTGYNVGFGAKKHFKSYDMFRVLPRFLTAIIIIVGIFQLLSSYKVLPAEKQELIAVLLLVVGFLAFVLDLSGEDKDKFNEVGKLLIELYNELARMYYRVDSMSENADFSSVENRLDEIVREYNNISLSKQGILLHWATHFGFFYSMQSDWVVKELKLTRKDKLPIWHWETFIFGVLLIVIALYIKVLFY